MDSAAPPAHADGGLDGRQARPVEGVDNGYVAGYRVRFDEAAPDGNLRASGLLRYAQDIAWRHSEALGFDRAWYQARSLGWVVRAVELELHAPIRLGTALRVTTAVVGHRRIWARRLAECRFADDRLAARMTTDWVLVDARNRIVRIPDDFGVAFLNPETRSEITRVVPPEGRPAATHALAVRPSDLDPLDHVNNAVYVDWLEEGLDAVRWLGARRKGPRLTGRVRLEYLASAALGDEVTVALYGTRDAWHAVIRRGDGTDLVRAAMEPLAPD